MFTLHLFYFIFVFQFISSYKWEKYVYFDKNNMLLIYNVDNDNNYDDSNSNNDNNTNDKNSIPTL